MGQGNMKRKSIKKLPTKHSGPKGYYLPDGSHVLLDGVPDEKLVQALNTMVEMGKKLKGK